MAGANSDPSPANTSWGLNRRYDVRFHVIGDDRRPDGSVRAVDRHLTCTVATPLGRHRAVALAALWFSRNEPLSTFAEVNVSALGDAAPGDHVDLRDPLLWDG